MTYPICPSQMFLDRRSRLCYWATAHSSDIAFGFRTSIRPRQDDGDGFEGMGIGKWHASQAAAEHSHLFSSVPFTQAALTQPVPLPSLWTSVALLVSARQSGSRISVSPVTTNASVLRAHRHASSLSLTWRLSFWTLGETTTSASAGKWPISAAYC